MNEAVEADRVLVMSQGEILMEGTPKDVFCQVDKIKELGLDVHQVTELAFELRKEVIQIRADILSVQELVEQL